MQGLTLPLVHHDLIRHGGPADALVSANRIIELRLLFSITSSSARKKEIDENGDVDLYKTLDYIETSGTCHLIFPFIACETRESASTKRSLEQGFKP